MRGNLFFLTDHTGVHMELAMIGLGRMPQALIAQQTGEQEQG